MKDKKKMSPEKMEKKIEAFESYFKDRLKDIDEEQKEEGISSERENELLKEEKHVNMLLAKANAAGDENETTLESLGVTKKGPKAEEAFQELVKELPDADPSKLAKSFENWADVEDEPDGEKDPDKDGDNDKDGEDKDKEEDDKEKDPDKDSDNDKDGEDKDKEKDDKAPDKDVGDESYKKFNPMAGVKRRFM